MHEHLEHIKHKGFLRYEHVICSCTIIRFMLLNMLNGPLLILCAVVFGRAGGGRPGTPPAGYP